VLSTSIATKAGNDTVVYQLNKGNLTGTYSGTEVGAAVVVIQPDGSLVARVTTTFTGTILGRSGTATDHIVCAGTATGPLTCVIMTVHGEGGLAGVHAILTSTSPAPPPPGTPRILAYSGLVWFTAQHGNNDGGMWSSPMTGSSQNDGSASTIPWSPRVATWNGTHGTIAIAPTSDANNDTIVYYLFNSTNIGSFVGTGVGVASLMIRPDGFAVDRSVLTFTGTFEGSALGTDTETVVQWGHFDLTTHATNQSGFILVGDGTGGLAGIHGFGTTSFSAGTGHANSMFTSTARIWFDHDDQK
jgi:hypothetical protein